MRTGPKRAVIIQTAVATPETPGGLHSCQHRGRVEKPFTSLRALGVQCSRRPQRGQGRTGWMLAGQSSRPIRRAGRRGSQWQGATVRRRGRRAAGSASVNHEAGGAGGWQVGFESLRQRIATSFGLVDARARSCDGIKSETSAGGVGAVSARV
jgi:hypothetical protein